jgi:L-xylulokinase
MTEPALIAIDAGGTAVKVVAFDLSGREITSHAADVKTTYHADGRVERDTEAFWRGTVQAIREGVDALEGRPILAVGCTGFGNGILLVDEEGRGTRPTIVSVDHRATPLVHELEASGMAATITRATGHRLWGGQTLMQLAHLARHEPEVMDRTRWALACKDFLRFRLTGEALTDPSDASGGALVDLDSQTYARDVFADLEMSHVLDRLPPIVANSAVAGRISARAAAETGLPEGIPVAGSMMDVAACALGAGSLGSDLLTMIAGTWSINGLETDSTALRQAPILNMTHRDGACRLIAEGSPSSAANLGWYLERALGGHITPADASARVAAAPIEGRRCHFLPFVFGPAPRRGAFLDLGATDDDGTMLRAIFEGVACQHRILAEAAAACIGRPIPEAIRLAGGASRSPVWAQVFADICQRPVEVAQTPEVGAMGVAICAAVAGGAYPNLVEAARAMTRVASVHQPTPAHRELFEERFDTFQRLDLGAAQLLAPKSV